MKPVFPMLDYDRSPAVHQETGRDQRARRQTSSQVYVVYICCLYYFSGILSIITGTRPDFLYNRGKEGILLFLMGTIVSFLSILFYTVIKVS